MTPLGLHLNRMPMDPRVGKALVYGCILGCLDPVLTVTAALAHGRPVFLNTQVRAPLVKGGRGGGGGLEGGLRPSLRVGRVLVVGCMGLFGGGWRLLGCEAKHSAALHTLCVPDPLFLQESTPGLVALHAPHSTPHPPPRAPAT